MLVNIIFFNISWFGLVLLGNSFIALTLVWLCFHLYFAKQSLAECKLVLAITLIGCLLDSILLATGVFLLNGQVIVPLWLVTLWAAFAATLAHALQFLSASKIQQAVVGFIFPPLSYLAGAALSPISLGYSQVTSYFILAIIWALLMLLFFKLKAFFFNEELRHA